MAVYRFSVQVISRGRSVLAAAAYRAGARLYDERLGLTSNYEKKPGIEHTEILAPDGAPEWVNDRERLWNAVNWRETHVKARLAREVQIALPAELSKSAQLELTRSFIQENFVARGMVADFAIHREVADNPHVHVLLTTRELDDSGFGRKRRDWDRKTMLFEWREAWERAANQALARAGRAERIDCRSYEQRGLDLTPQPKLFRHARQAHLDARDHVLERAVELVKVKRRNGAYLAAHPEQAFELLTSSGKRPSFSERDLERLIDRQTASTEQYEDVLAAVRASSELVSLGVDDGGFEQFSTRAIVKAERALLDDGHLLAHRSGHTVDEALVKQAIREAPPLQGLAHALSDEQASAVRYVTQTGDFAVVEGYAGTGKSTMLAAARTAWEAQGYKVVGGALAGKAADGLTDSAGIESRTLASWQWSWERGKLRLSSAHVLVLDEAGMVGTTQLSEIMAEVRQAGAKLVLVGDTKQLQAIDPGAPMRLLQKRHGSVTLSQIRRQQGHAWQREATLALAEGRAAEALGRYEAQGRVVGCPTAETAYAAMVARWAADRRAAPDATSLLLAFRRVDVRALNEAARAVRATAGELGPDHRVETERGERSFARGDRLCFLKNDAGLGVKNGTLGTIEAIRDGALVVRLDSHKEVVVDTRTYNALDHGYASTIHKSQGVTVDHAYVFASRYMDASASYVAMSRHRIDAHLFYSQQEFDGPDALIRRLGRARTVEMAHEVLDKLGTETSADARRLAVHAAFLSLTLEEQLSKLEALRMIGEQKQLSTADVLRSLPAMREAERRRVQAKERLSRAERALEHAVADRRRPAHSDAALARLTALVERCRKEHGLAERAVAAAGARPELWKQVRERVREHNGRVRTAQKRWRELHVLYREGVRAEALRDLARDGNVKAGKTRFRVAAERDVGKLFDQVAARTLRGDDVLVLRSREGGGSLVLAYADHCGDVHGRRLVRSPTRPAYGPTKGRARGPER